MKKYWQIKPWMFIVLILILAASLFFALGDGVNYLGYKTESESTGGMRAEYAPSPVADESYYDADDKEEAVERMVIKTGSLSVVVNDIRKSVKDIVTYVEGKGGFLVTSNVSKSGIDLSGNVTVRVPSASLETTIEYVKAMGEVADEHIDGRDITEEYVDLESKLGNLRATETQFLAIMKMAVKIEDVLAVQKELSYVRENIEMTEGRIKYLKESVDLSSLTIYLSTNPSTLPVIDKQDEWKPFAVFKEALRSLLDTGKEVLNATIWFGVYLPVIVVIFLVVWGIKRYITRKRKQ